MKKATILFLYTLLLAHLAPSDSAPAGQLIKHLSFLLRRSRASTKAPQADGNVVQFENGYLVETVVEGSKLGVEPYSIRVSQEGELFAVDSVNSKIVRITPPLSPYSRARLVAGSFQGYSGHVDGKPSDARFNRPKGVAMDDRGNVYVADTENLAIRKIGDSGVTTIAGGKSNIAGYRDGPSEDAKFSHDFDLIYERRSCSLLVIDRGNAAIRQISLLQEDCNQQNTSLSASDVLLVLGVVLVGYFSGLIHHGCGFSFFSKSSSSTTFITVFVGSLFSTSVFGHYPEKIEEPEFQENPAVEKPTVEEPTTFLVESIKEDPIAGWPSFGRLITDLSKQALEALGSLILSSIPFGIGTRGSRSKQNLTPLKDSLIMPEDKQEPQVMQKQRIPIPSRTQTHLEMRSEIPQAAKTTNTYTQQKPSRIKSTSIKDPSFSVKHRSTSKRQDVSEYYGSTEPSQSSQSSASKSQKERTRHRHREKTNDHVLFGAAGGESKHVEIRSVDYGDPKFDHYNIRSKFATEDHLFRL